MLTKALKTKEVELGFIHIPTKSRDELIGDVQTPFATKVNDNHAKMDKFGRLWSVYLKQKYPIGTYVRVEKNDIGFQITPIAQLQEITNAQSIEHLVAGRTAVSAKKVTKNSEKLPITCSIETLSNS
jgi:hypothetical protein